ncbi:MAG: metal-dependent hydrolase, partial [Candidatus Hodarchaeota archaeon]
MTLIPTHFSLQSILFWTFIPSSEKERFQQKKLSFWAVVAFSVLPDLDIFIGVHRGLFHSIILPLIMTILGTVIYYHYSSSGIMETEEDIITNYDEKRSFMGRCILYAGIFWLIHVFLDLEYPLAIFYPLSDRLYQFNFVILFDIMPWLIFPATIAGIGFEISGLSYLRGLTTYFVNLPPSIREEIYGHEPVAFYIDDFFIHAILFVIFLVYVARPMVPTFNLSRLTEWREKIRFDGPILVFGIIMLVMGFVIGPLVGTHTIDTDSISGSFQVSPISFSPTIAIKFETTNYLLQPNTVFSIESTLITSSDSDPFDHVLLLTTQEYYKNFSSGVSQLFKQYPFNTSENIFAFETNYQSLLLDLITFPLAMNLTNLNETSLHTKLSSGSFMVVGVIEYWDSVQIMNGTHLYENTKLEVTITSSRFTLMIFGSASIIIGVIILVFSARVKK